MTFFEILREYNIIGLENFARKVRKMSNDEILNLYEALLDDLSEWTLQSSLFLDLMKETTVREGKININYTAVRYIGLISDEFAQDWERWNTVQKVKGIWDMFTGKWKELVKYSLVLLRRMSNIREYTQLDSFSLSLSASGPGLVFTFRKPVGVSKKKKKRKRV